MAVNDWLTRAISLHKRGDHNAALEACGAAPNQPQAQMMAHTVRAAALAKLARLDDAHCEANAALALGARSPKLCRLAAHICIARDDLGAARDCIDHGLNERSAPRELLHLRRQVVADMHLLTGMHEHHEFAARLQPNSVDARENLIDSFLKRRAYALAKPHLEFAVAQDPGRVSLQIDKAIVEMETGHAVAAVQTLRHALTLTAGTDSRLRITRLLVKAGALEQAWRVAQHDLAAAPEAVNLRVQYGFLALWQGDLRAAEAAGRDIPMTAPGVSRLRAAIAFVNRQDTTVLGLAGEAIADDAEAHALAAAALFRLGRYEEAHQRALTATRKTQDWLPGAQLVLLGSRPTPASYEIAELFTLLAPLLPPPATVSQPDGQAASQSLLCAIDNALERLSGNFTDALTFLSDGSRTWSSLSPLPPARVTCVRVFDWINLKPWPWVAEQLAALAAHYPGSPYVHTHTAELWLWAGEYARCEAECLQALALTRSAAARWAWVGLGGALMLQGRLDEAIGVFADSARLMEPGPPLLAYRGETLRRRGQFAAARRDFSEALTSVPTCVSSWLNLGLIAAAQRRHDEVREIFARLRAHMPLLMRDIQRDQGDHGDHITTSPAVMATTFEHALHCMRGNRSSQRIIYFLQDGIARVLPARDLGANDAHAPSDHSRA